MCPVDFGCRYGFPISEHLLSRARNCLESGRIDEQAGIVLSLVEDRVTYATYVAHVKSAIPEHWHNVGGELYTILEGHGSLRWSKLESQDGHSVMTVLESGQFPVFPGCSFSIPPQYGHSLIPDGPILLQLDCLKAHLTTDRFFIENPISYD
jgi:uncharacterized cupin superfamily protein